MKKLLAVTILMFLTVACGPAVIPEPIIIIVTATSLPATATDVPPTVTIIPVTATSVPATATEWPTPTSIADHVAYKAEAIQVSLEDLHNRPEDYNDQIVRIDYDVFTPPLEPAYYGQNYGDDYIFLDPIHKYTDVNLTVQCAPYHPACYKPGLRELVIAGGGSVIVWGKFSSSLQEGREIDVLFAAIVELAPRGAQRATQQSDPLTQMRGSGFYLVGVDIAPGVWRSTPGIDNCYWKVSTKTGGIIDNHFGMSGGTCYISASAYMVEFDDCGMWEYLGQ